MATSDVIIAANALIEAVSDNLPSSQYSQKEWMEQVGKMIALDNQRDQSGTLGVVGDAARILAHAAGLTIREDENK